MLSLCYCTFYKQLFITIYVIVILQKLLCKITLFGNTGKNHSIELMDYLSQNKLHVNSHCKDNYFEECNMINMQQLC